MPERRKVATKTTRKGQRQGQQVDPARLRLVAAEHNVSEDWLRLVTEGSLDDPAFVQAVREANNANLWLLVSPVAQEALARPTLNVEQIGGSRNDVLLVLLEILQGYGAPENSNFFATRTPLQYLEEVIEWEVDDFRRREPLELRKQINAHALQAEEERYRLRLQVEALRPHAEQARRSAIGRTIGNQVRAEAAVEENEPRVREWLRRVESRDKKRCSEAAVHRIIAAEEEDITTEAVKKAIQRHREKHP